MTLADFPPVFLTSVAVSLGLAFGSFLNVVIYRLPRGLNLAYPGSACPACDTPIKGYDNVPVLGWLVLRGKARCCGAPISPRYPMIELMGGLMAWAILQRVVLELPLETEWWRALLLFAVHLALGLGLIAAAFIDLEHMILPDEITLGGTVLGLASVWLRPGIEFTDALIGAAVGFVMVWLPFDVLYRRIRGQVGMGLGDAKLVMLAGAWFGWPGAVFTLLAGAVQGTLGAIAMLLTRGEIEEPPAIAEQRAELLKAIEEAEGDERLALIKEFEDDPLSQEAQDGLGQARLAFGPFLVLATLEYQLFGALIVDTYLNYLWQP